MLSTNKSTSPKTSELEQYFVQDMVDSFNIDYGSGQIEITLKEGMSPIKSTDSDSQSATTATQPATEQQKTQSNSKKSKIVVKGQLADIQRFLDDIKPYYNPASTDEIPHNLTRATIIPYLWNDSDTNHYDYSHRCLGAHYEENWAAVVLAARK